MNGISKLKIQLNAPTPTCFLGSYVTVINSVLISGLAVHHGDGLMDVTYRIVNAQPLLKDVVPPRHRRKKRDEDITTNSQPVQTQNKESMISRGAQFDLVEEAFPPLPGNVLKNFHLIYLNHFKSF